MVKIVSEPIRHQDIVQSVCGPGTGAVVTFDGTVRNHARGKAVTHLFYEAFPEMAEKELEKIRREALSRWALQALAIVHRIGRLEIGESSVFIVAASAHRKDAFEACRFAIDTLKSRAPIWKKEHYEAGEVWVEEQPT